MDECSLAEQSIKGKLKMATILLGSFSAGVLGVFEEVEDASEQMIEAEVVHATTSQEDLC